LSSVDHLFAGLYTLKSCGIDSVDVKLFLNDVPTLAAILNSKRANNGTLVLADFKKDIDKMKLSQGYKQYKLRYVEHDLYKGVVVQLDNWDEYRAIYNKYGEPASRLDSVYKFYESRINNGLTYDRLFLEFDLSKRK
jgi:hypothetical protein